MEIFSLREYFISYIKIMEGELPVDKQLEPKELDFLVECCYFNSTGGDLNNFDELFIYLSGLGKFTRRSDVSTYKKKLSSKKWIRSRKNYYILPKALDVLVKDNGFAVWVSNDTRKIVSILEFCVSFKKDVKK